MRNILLSACITLCASQVAYAGDLDYVYCSFIDHDNEKAYVSHVFTGDYDRNGQATKWKYAFSDSLVANYNLDNDLDMSWVACFKENSFNEAKRKVETKEFLNRLSKSTQQYKILRTFWRYGRD